MAPSGKGTYRYFPSWLLDLRGCQPLDLDPVRIHLCEIVLRLRAITEPA